MWFVNIGGTMKLKKILSVLLLSAAIAIPSFAHAIDISIGAATWYSNWEMKTAAGNGQAEKTQNLKTAFMYGPVAALKFSQDWSISSAFLYTSDFEMTGEYGFVSKMKRLDWDTLINYNINSYLKLFAGAKYMNFKFDGGDHWSAGPGFGLGLTIPVYDSLYFIGNLSGMYLPGKHKDPGVSTSMKEYGFNAAANLAYYFESISLTLSAGYRFQFFVSRYSSSNKPENESTFSGFTASVIYSF